MRSPGALQPTACNVHFAQSPFLVVRPGTADPADESPRTYTYTYARTPSTKSLLGTVARADQTVARLVDHRVSLARLGVLSGGQVDCCH